MGQVEMGENISSKVPWHINSHRKWDFQPLSTLKIPSSKNLNISVQSFLAED